MKTMLLLMGLLYLFSSIDVGQARDIITRNGTNQSQQKITKETGVEMDRILQSECSKDDIVIYQGPTTPMPNGIPTYTVQIMNVCIAGNSISNIHVSCGWFSSARLINPNKFRRLCYDDCLVNNGEAIEAGQELSFQYANSFPYPLSISSVSCQ